MKKISFMIPCFNEEKNIRPMVEILTRIMADYSDKYDYEIIYRDNCSTDNSMNVLKELASEDRHIKIIRNARNYGQNFRKNSFKGRISGDLALMIAGDLQEPPELIPEFIKWYEKGYEAVCGQKIASEEGKIKYALRQVFYSIIDIFSDTPQIRNMSGIILLSRRLIDMLWESDSYPAVRYFLADLGCDVKLIQYKQRKRKYGKTSYNVWSSLAFSINALIETSTKPLRIATVAGMLMAALTFTIGFVYLIWKLVLWDRFSMGTAPLLIGLFFIGSVLLFFIGIVGEYVGNILGRVKHNTPPIVTELINFENPEEDPYLFKTGKNCMIDEE